MTKLCSIEGCGNPHNASGWCGMHYQRFKRHGDPLGVLVRHRLGNCERCGRQMISGLFGRTESTVVPGVCSSCSNPSDLRAKLHIPEPAYCTCTGTITRSPGLRDECADCRRRIPECFDDIPGDMISVETR
jgi:hypothetical protein